MTRPPHGRGRASPALAGVLATLALAVMIAVGATATLVLATGTNGGLTASTELSSGASELALHEIPPEYLRLYQGAAHRYAIDWAVLAGIGRVECDHGLDPDPSCTVEGAVNSAGAGGPMQFLASTWATYGVDGNADGRRDRWNAADAIFSAANYLRASGAPADYARAIFAYNHASWYVAEVESWAARYRGTPITIEPPGGTESVEGGSLGSSFTSPTPIRFIEGSVARLDPQDGHLALIPSQAPAVIQAMLVAGNELQELPYGPAGHPDPRDSTQEDCSSTINYVLYRSGVRPISEILRQNPLAQDYVHWGAPGPGRWITIYATATPTPHVFAVIAGLRLDTSYSGTDEGPNRFQGGPRWRILGHIPTWAHWAVRHPVGL